MDNCMSGGSSLNGSSYFRATDDRFKATCCDGQQASIRRHAPKTAKGRTWRPFAFHLMLCQFGLRPLAPWVERDRCRRSRLPVHVRFAESDRML
jgi:hypothetical protein